jgi:hypothetical protein
VGLGSVKTASVRPQARGQSAAADGRFSCNTQILDGEISLFAPGCAAKGRGGAIPTG